MYNPLLSDVGQLKDSELENKILDLNKKFHIAAKMGYGQICEQIVIALNVYKDETLRRQKVAMEKLAKKQDNDFDDLINVD